MAAQTVGIAGALCNEVPAAKELFNKASAILGYDLLDKVLRRNIDLFHYRFIDN